MESKYNQDEFPRSFVKGIGEGFWWSFISMTTVGYGDRAPKSILGRIFGIIWTLTGLVIIGILIGAVASSLTSVNVEKEIILYGAKVGAIHNSTEHNIGILKSAKVNTERKYTNLDELRTALEVGEIEGALLDTYVAAENKGTFLDDRVFVKDILDRPFGYGVVLSGAARNVEQRCRDYIALHISEIFHMIANKTKTLDPSHEGIKDSTGLFDGTSQMFLIATVSLMSVLGVAVIAGLSYHCLMFVPRKKRDIELKTSSPKSAYKGFLVKELQELVDHFYTKMSTKISLIKEIQKRKLREMKEAMKNSKKQQKSETTSSSNPAYFSAQEPDGLSGRRVHFITAKSILQHCEEWPSPCPAALNKAADAISIDSACPSMTSDDYAASTSDVRYQDTECVPPST